MFITYALFAVRADFESFVAFAFERSFGVDTMAVFAQVAVSGAFVDVAAVVGHTNLSVAFGADAHKGADQIFASELAIVGRRGALVDVLAVTAVGRQRVTVRANATERAGHVVTAEGALVAHFLTLVHVLANLHGTRCESFGTVTLESSLHVGTRSVATNVGNSTFVIIYPSRNYQKKGLIC